MDKLIPLVALVVFGGSFAIAPVDAKECKKGNAECKKAAKDECCEDKKASKDGKASSKKEAKAEDSKDSKEASSDKKTDDD